MATSDKSGQGRAGSMSPVYRSGAPKETDSARAGTAASVIDNAGNADAAPQAPAGGRASSKLVFNGDPGDKKFPGSKKASETTYKATGYNPKSEVENFSYTSTRVAKRVYNRYPANDLTVFGYYTDWSQYDARLEGDTYPADAGRGADLMLLSATAYDKLIIGFAGIVGDMGEKASTISRAATDFERKTNEATFVDAWGDVASYVNCGFPGWISNDYMDLFTQETAQGVLGGLAKLKKKNPNLTLSFSLGGWTMSEAFHRVCADAGRRQTLVDSIASLLQRFPMFEAIDLDWEYPNAVGNGNPHGPEDAANFQLLVSGIKKKLPKLKISIAAGASLTNLQSADIPGMIAAGVEGINLMTYDFFGTPWAPTLAHHTNLHASHPDDPDEFSVDAAVDYLLANGVPSKQIFIGYAAYSRNARNAEISEWSPLTGTYDAGSGTTVGTFESGTTEWYDLIYNYVDFEHQTGLNGFNLYTDEIADADYLYNPGTQLFMSVDTPRSVKAKGDYVRERGLGGLFTWTIEMDNGVLLNAAREGLGGKAITQAVDMAPLYCKGVNVKD
ncbi:glycoside hydrolase family 18 protein [Paraburkholderia sp. BCC1886]|uniref:glycoside hydrolase family 18 protein n=1 Tax=Paraburkholderia sp. BCC1886 TaxID=2562670 RepID=UPI0021B26E50|nr:glycoside hydrolase family 18 protein [Paraburkholderia sp. BCC1886]